MQILSWNLNSIRVRLNHLNQILLQYSTNSNPQPEPSKLTVEVQKELETEQPPKIQILTELPEDILQRLQLDAILLQETRVNNFAFPYQNFKGLNILTHGEKGRNGLCIISKHELKLVTTCLYPDYLETRFMHATITLEGKLVHLINVYVPQGQNIDSPAYLSKLQFLENLAAYLEKFIYDDVVLAGDFNIALYAKDVVASVALNHSLSFTQKERMALHRILNLGFVTTSLPGEFTWFDYRNKQAYARIDYIFLSHSLHFRLIASEQQGLPPVTEALKLFRAKAGCSDHIPLLLHKA